MKCYNCCDKITTDDSLGAEVATRKGKPVWKDVCRSCYEDIVQTCQVCGNDDLMPSDVSRFILVKQELGETAVRPPGIYEILYYPFLSIPMIGSGSMGAGDVLFIDHLPKPDRHYDISGHICNNCARTYARIRRAVYGRKKMTRSWNPKTWRLQREHVRSVILAHPDMLRDLECDKDDCDWKDLQHLFCLPDDLPTYNEWLLLKYRGVKVFMTHETEQRGEGWLSLRPEPKYRCGGPIHDEPGVIFTATSLPTFPQWDYDAPENKDVYHSPNDWAHQHALTAIRRAIKAGYITQKSTLDAKGNVHLYG
jgi:hypothetical protein